MDEPALLRSLLHPLIAFVPALAPSQAGYAFVALLVGGESAGLPIPGETSLVAAAVLASQGRLSLPLVIAVAAGAAIVGDNVGYWLGRSGARPLLRRRGRSQRLLARAEVFFARRGPYAVFVGRWLPGLRMTVAWLAGASRMRWSVFLVSNALGGIAWATSIGLAGYVLGRFAQTVLSAAALALLVLILLAGCAVVLVRRRRARRSQPPERPYARSSSRWSA